MHFAHVGWLTLLALATGCSGDPETGGGSCDDRSAAAGRAIDEAAAAADTACTTDADCTVVQLSSGCSESCDAAVVSQTGAAAIEQAQRDAESRICRTFASDGCTVERVPCPSPPHDVTCGAGTCRAQE